MEATLKKTREDYTEKQIWQSQVIVIDRLLRRSLEMQEVYDDLKKKLESEQQLQNFWDAMLGAAAFWNPDSSKQLREEKKNLKKLNKEINECASKLSGLLKKRYEISESSSISSYEDYHVLHWIERSSRNNHLHQSYVREELNGLKYRYDLKYWPRTDELVDAIAEFAREAEICVADEWTAELISSPKHSMSDFLKVILKALNDRKDSMNNPYPLPDNFRLTDNSLATLINCVLDLEPEKLISGEYIKRARQNIKDKEKV